MENSPKKIGLVGVFEDYLRRATGPSFLTSPGIEYGDTKVKLMNGLNHIRDLDFVHDSYYVHPAATTFGKCKLGTGLAYLYTSLANILERQSHGRSVFVFQSVVDLYAEIELSHGYQEWLYPLIEREVQSYDMLVYVAPKDRRDHHENTLAVTWYDDKINYLLPKFETYNTRVERCQSVDEAIETIRSLWKT